MLSFTNAAGMAETSLARWPVSGCILLTQQDLRGAVMAGMLFQCQKLELYWMNSLQRIRCWPEGVHGGRLDVMDERHFPSTTLAKYPTHSICLDLVGECAHIILQDGMADNC